MDDQSDNVLVRCSVNALTRPNFAAPPGSGPPPGAWGRVTGRLQALTATVIRLAIALLIFAWLAALVRRRPPPQRGRGPTGRGRRAAGGAGGAGGASAGRGGEASQAARGAR